MTVFPERLVASSLPEEVWQLLLSEAYGTIPEEACGLLVGSFAAGQATITEAVPCENVAPIEHRRRRFTIDPRRLIDEERTLRGSGRQVVGFYHSHPTGPGIPSSVDRGFMDLWPDVIWLIVEEAGDPERATLRAWTFNGEGSGAPREIPLTRGLALRATK